MRFSVTLRPQRRDDVRWILVASFGLDGEFAVADRVRVR
jgi:hypothetical protein